jgi:hypothetical protein
MLKELFDAINSQARKAAKAELLEVPGLRNQSLMILDGASHTVPFDIPARQHAVHNLESLKAVIAEHADCVVWHAADKIVAVLNDKDDSYRDDCVRWDLSPSTKWTALTRNAQQPRDHQPFVAFIVENLRDEFSASFPDILSMVRSIKFTTRDEQSGDVQLGRESMSREVLREMAGLTGIPETITLKVPRWASLDHVADVECMLIADLATRKLSLKPLADQLERAELAAQAFLHELLTAQVGDKPVYYGTP